MRIRFSAIISALFVSSLFLTACGNQDEAKQAEPKVTAQDVTKESKEALNKAVAYSEQKKMAYLEEIEDELQAYDQKLDKLKAGAVGLKDDARDEYNQQIALLEEKRKSALETLSALKSATGKTWNDMKSGMDKALNDLQDSYDKVSAYFQGSNPGDNVTREEQY